MCMPAFYTIFLLLVIQTHEAPFRSSDKCGYDVRKHRFTQDIKAATSFSFSHAIWAYLANSMFISSLIRTTMLVG